MTRHLITVVLALTVGHWAALTSASAEGSRQPPVVTFAGDVAPILFEHCAACHRPNGPGPFSVLTFDDVGARAELIAEVTGRREMPPWKPAPHEAGFIGQRGLSGAEIDTLRRWADAGAPEGDPASLPPAPQWPTGWRLGTPDLVLSLPAYEVPARERDTLRVFAVPIPVSASRYVQGFEVQSQGSVVHHANIRLDRTGTARGLDDEDPMPGYEGAVPVAAVYPPGHFLGWTPGQLPPLVPELAWRLDPGTDLVVQLHLQPTDRPMTIQPRVALYFTDQAPARMPSTVRLSRRDMDIPPGEGAYQVRDSYVLPVDAEVYAVQPHAHYRARSARAWAELPDGTRRSLIDIPEWDFDWQDTYRYREPFWLPAGARLVMDYVFDNSADNLRNPDSPPRRVTFGFEARDEMADLMLQVFARTPADLATLNRHSERKMLADEARGYETIISTMPGEAALHDAAAQLYLGLAQLAPAERHYRRSLELRPESARAHYNLGTTLHAWGRIDEAAGHYREAVQLDPEHAGAHNNLGNVLLLQGGAEEAVTHYQRAVASAPAVADFHNSLGFGLMQVGRTALAVASLRRALAIAPGHPDAHYNLGNALSGGPSADEAVTHFREVLRVRPNWMPAMRDLAWLLATDPTADGNPGEALSLAAGAAALSGRRDPRALDALAAAYAAAGRFVDAAATAEAAIDIAPPDLRDKIAARLALYRQDRPFVASGR